MPDKPEQSLEERYANVSAAYINKNIAALRRKNFSLELISDQEAKDKIKAHNDTIARLEKILAAKRKAARNA